MTTNSSVLQDFCERVRTANAITSFAHVDPSLRCNPNSASERLDVRTYNGIVEFSAGDQVVVVRSGTLMKDLQSELRTYGHCFPIPNGFGPLGMDSSLHDHLAFNFPYLGESRFGAWRDWILGMTILRADGSLAKSGSLAVKSVAGYDAHKLMIGARGTLAIVVEVILRTLPLAAYRLSSVELDFDWGSQLWIQRTLATDFPTLLQASEHKSRVIDEESCTLWANVEPSNELMRFPCDWLLRTGCGQQNLPQFDANLAAFMNRTKTIFDPTGKLNPGEMGIF